MVEAAIITPVLFMLIFGIFESGFLLRNYLTAGNAVQEAGRQASVNGNDETADYLTLKAIEHGYESWDLEAIDTIVIFAADGPDATVPDICTTPGSDGVDTAPEACQVYTSENVVGPSYFDLSGNVRDDWECEPVDNWCPVERNTRISGTDHFGTTGTSYVGVYVESTHESIIGFYPDITFSHTEIHKLEPRSE